MINFIIFLKVISKIIYPMKMTLNKVIVIGCNPYVKIIKG
jgi:hypothetical protein